MSLNLGNLGVDAAKALRGNSHWRDLIKAVGDVASARMNDALSAPDRQDATGYARALRDVYVAFASATEDKPQNQIAKPGVERR